MNELKDFCITMQSVKEICGTISDVTFTDDKGVSFTGAESVQAMANNITALNSKE